MSEKVRSLFGGAVPCLEPDAAVVKELERLLEMARSGEITAVHGVMTYRDETVGLFRVGFYRTYTVAGALEKLKMSVLSDDE